MNQDAQPRDQHGASDTTAASLFRGGGDMGARMRALNWAATPFGEPETWPQSLRAAVSICLHSRFPIAIYWGPQLALIYNDAWSPIPGEKHPWALGRAGHEVWPEIWTEIGPLFHAVQQSGEGVWQQDQLLPMHRHGYTEECYFNFTFSPIRGEDGTVVGIFNAVVETTFRVIEERRAHLLRNLSEQLAAAPSANDVCVRAADVFRPGVADLPFCLFYLRESAATPFRLVTTTGAALPASVCPAVLDSADATAPWPVAQALQSTSYVVLDRLSERFGGALASGVWPEAVAQAVIVPIGNLQAAEPIGFMIAGVNPRRALDAAYSTFIERAAMQITNAINNARALDAERRRAAALADIDRAKTTFFSNISHEFRTPLTLILGPLDDLLHTSAGVLPAAEREQIAVAHRNSLRLLKLVNTLLSFAQIEAGRAEAVYAPTDLAALTAELASVFRSAIERAGLRLNIDCPPLAAAVYVDHDLWEKIVFNLLSNAVKFTFTGAIDVALRQSGSMVELTVRDTGTGIPPAELPHVFERFHRVKDARGRTFEGSGIGLALVQECVHLHGGSVHVESTLDQGTMFTVRIPTGSAHLPASQIGPAQTHDSPHAWGEAYVTEALRWVPAAAGSDQDAAMQPAPAQHAMADNASDATVRHDAPRSGGPRSRPLIVLADDNADMREYVERLLRERYAVVAVADGKAALAAIRQHLPELVLSDVMMPELDGFGLLQALRADAQVREIPVILLSARAGEEARVEGMEAGAEDYLMKPFAARELLALVEAHLKLQQVRRAGQAALRASEEKFAAAFNQSPLALTITSLENGQLVDVNAGFVQLSGYTRDEVIGRDLDTLNLWVEPDHRREGLARLQVGERVADLEMRFRIKSGDIRTGMIGAARIDINGRPHILSSVADITTRKQAEDALAASEARARLAIQVAQLGTWRYDPTTNHVQMDERMRAIWGEPAGTTAMPLAAIIARIHPDDRAWVTNTITGALDPASPGVYDIECRIVRPDGTERWITANGQAQFEGTSPQRRVTSLFGTALDITGRKQTEERLQRIQTITARLAETQTLDDVCRIMLHDITNALEADGSGLRLVGDHGLVLNEYELGVHMRMETAESMRFLSFDTKHPAVDAARSGEAVFLRDAEAARAHYPQLTTLVLEHGSQASAHLPLAGGGVVFGVLSLSFAKQRAWDAAECAFALALADRTAIAYERARLFEAERSATAREQALRVKAEEASRLKDEFLATVSHELRTPLTSFLGYAQLLQTRKRDEAYVARTLEKMVQSARVQAQLIEDLLDVSGIINGKLRLDMQPTQLTAVIEAALDTVRPTVEAKGLQLVIDLDQDASPVIGDANRLQQIVWNLLTNAVKFTPSSGTIHVRLQRHGHEAQIVVRDTGRGIAATFLPFVFDRFRQADGASTRAYNGLGLGLAIVRHLAELHGGTVGVASAGEGQGATFTVQLPLIAAAAFEEPATASDDQTTHDDCPPALRGLRILIVDDQPALLALLQEILEPCGAVLKLCSSANEALAALAVWPPDLLISDIAMPQQDGYWLIRQLRARPPELGGQLPAIALTAYVRTEERIRALTAGFNQYVPKPVEPNELRAVVASLARMTRGGAQSTPTD